MTTKFACIESYLRSKHRKVYDALESVCIGSLRPRFGRGVTLLLPTGKFLDEIVENVDKDQEKALEQLQACILNDSYQSISSLHMAKGTISNRLNQDVEVSVSGMEGKLSNGSTIKKSDFVPIDSRQNVNVFVLDGPMVLNGKTAKPAEKVDKSRVKGTKTEGGAEHSNSRWVLAKRVEKDFCMYMMGAVNNQGLKRSPYEDAVAALIDYLEYAPGADKSALEQVKAVIDTCPITSFYLIFEPYSDQHRVITDDVFAHFIKHNINCRSTRESLDSISVKNADFTKVNDARIQILNKAVKDQPAELLKVYENVHGGDAKLALARDEFRLFVNNSYEEFQTVSNFDLQEFVDFVRAVETKYNFKSVSDQTTLDKYLMKNLVRPKEFYYSTLYGFVMSTCLLYEHRSDGDWQGLSDKTADGDDLTNVAARGIGHVNNNQADNDNYESAVAKVACWESCHGKK